MSHKFIESLIGGGHGPNGVVNHCYSDEGAHATCVRIPEKAHAMQSVVGDHGQPMGYVATVRHHRSPAHARRPDKELLWCASWTVDSFVAAMLLSDFTPHVVEPLNALQHYASAASRREVPKNVESTWERVIDTSWGPIEILLEDGKYAEAAHAAEGVLSRGNIERFPAETADAIDRWKARLAQAHAHVRANGFLTDGVMVVHDAPLGAFTRVRSEIWTPALKYSGWAIAQSRDRAQLVEDESTYAIAGSRRLPTEYRRIAIETVRAVLEALESLSARERNRTTTDCRWLVTELLECVPARGVSSLSLAQVHRVVRDVVGSASNLRVDAATLAARFAREEAKPAPSPEEDGAKSNTANGRLIRVGDVVHYSMGAYTRSAKVLTIERSVYGCFVTVIDSEYKKIQVPLADVRPTDSLKSTEASS